MPPWALYNAVYAYVKLARNAETLAWSEKLHSMVRFCRFMRRLNHPIEWSSVLCHWVIVSLATGPEVKRTETLATA